MKKCNNKEKASFSTPTGKWAYKLSYDNAEIMIENKNYVQILFSKK